MIAPVTAVYPFRSVAAICLSNAGKENATITDGVVNGDQRMIN